MDSSPKPPEHDARAAARPAAGRTARYDRRADQAQDDAIALARRHIKVFDIDLSWGGWNAAARCEMLSAYLRRIPGARFDIIVHDTHWIESSGARLTTLLVRHAHAMKIYRTASAARAVMDPLLIVDDTHFVHRFHVDHAGGALSIGAIRNARSRSSSASMKYGRPASRALPGRCSGCDNAGFGAMALRRIRTPTTKRLSAVPPRDSARSRLRDHDGSDPCRVSRRSSHPIAGSHRA